jgi:hypothetical protein
MTRDRDNEMIVGRCKAMKARPCFAAKSPPARGGRFDWFLTIKYLRDDAFCVRKP